MMSLKKCKVHELSNLFETFLSYLWGVSAALWHFLCENGVLYWPKPFLGLCKRQLNTELCSVWLGVFLPLLCTWYSMQCQRSSQVSFECEMYFVLSRCYCFINKLWLNDGASFPFCDLTTSLPWLIQSWWVSSAHVTPYFASDLNAPRSRQNSCGFFLRCEDDLHQRQGLMASQPSWFLLIWVFLGSPSLWFVTSYSYFITTITEMLFGGNDNLIGL